MKSLLILVKMQLKEQLNFKRLGVEGAKPLTVVVSVLAAVLRFAAVTAACAGLLWVANYLHIFSLGNSIPDAVISLVFSVMLLTSVISCVVGLTKSLYYARDNAVLLTLPCKPIQVYLSKLIIFFAFEVKRNFSFLVPLFIAYFITEGTYHPLVYPWLIFCIVWISLFTVSLGALLSIPAMWIANFFRQHKWLQLTALALVLCAFIALFTVGVASIPDRLDFVESWEVTLSNVQAFFGSYKYNFSFLYEMSHIFLGEKQRILTTPTFPPLATFLRFLALAGLSAVLFAVGLLIVRPLFYKMASTPFEYLKRQTKPKKNKLRTRRFSAVYNEFLISVKSSERLATNIGVLIALPMLLMLLNKLLFAMDISTLGYNMTVAFNLLICLLVVLNSNTYAASIFSRDGRSSYLIKTQPSKYPILILSKLLPNTVFVSGAIAATLAVLLAFSDIGALNSVLLIFAVGAAYLAHLLYCAELDLMNPQVELYATVGTSESNPNEARATVTAFAISVVAAAIFFLLLLEQSGTSVYVKLLVCAVAALVYRVHLFFAKIKLYYKEK